MPDVMLGLTLCCVCPLSPASPRTPRRRGRITIAGSYQGSHQGSCSSRHTPYLFIGCSSRPTRITYTLCLKIYCLKLSSVDHISTTGHTPSCTPKPVACPSARNAICLLPKDVRPKAHIDRSSSARHMYGSNCGTTRWRSPRRYGRSRRSGAPRRPGRT